MGMLSGPPSQKKRDPIKAPATIRHPVATLASQIRKLCGLSYLGHFCELCDSENWGREKKK